MQHLFYFIAHAHETTPLLQAILLQMWFHVAYTTIKYVRAAANSRAIAYNFVAAFILFLCT